MKRWPASGRVTVTGPASRSDLGGLGHMGVKLAVALGAQVTVITTSPSKAEDALALGAHEVLLPTDQKAMMASLNAFVFILDTPKRHDVNLLGRNGVLCVVGAIDLLDPVQGALLIRSNRRR
ncbi:zinc-binding dehydrogenase [Variovorax robiniae]|uniref:zinc-binding dehydrogenase n=1 Tax=Variovorax robiniae TaxID=1836199 RepID=UPI003BF5784F